MALGYFHREQPGRAAHIAKRLVWAEIKLLGKRFEIEPGQSRHAAEELFQPGRIRIQFLEHGLAAVLYLVLRLPRPERFRQIVPEFEESSVQHLQDPANVPRAVAIEIQSRQLRV